MLPPFPDEVDKLMFILSIGDNQEVAMHYSGFQCFFVLKHEDKSI
ncbi:hypothetical protein VINI7043_19188 [Vibrio nigripulchritudo ATCC 27043]|nr:hypothetical protein VINI7043_19188 [Vibrio nigripulchritudo ATCC 27043]